MSKDEYGWVLRSDGEFGWVWISIDEWGWVIRLRMDEYGWVWMRFNEYGWVLMNMDVVNTYSIEVFQTRINPGTTINVNPDTTLSVSFPNLVLSFKKVIQDAKSNYSHNVIKAEY